MLDENDPITLVRPNGLHASMRTHKLDEGKGYRSLPPARLAAAAAARWGDGIHFHCPDLEPHGRPAGHYCDRVKVTAAGCLLWAAMTSIFGSARSLQQGVAAWAVNGLGLAMVGDPPLPDDTSRIPNQRGYHASNQSQSGVPPSRTAMAAATSSADVSRTPQLAHKRPAQRLGSRPCNLAEWTRRWRLRLWQAGRR